MHVSRKHSLMIKHKEAFGKIKYMLIFLNFIFFEFNEELDWVSFAFFLCSKQEIFGDDPFLSP